VIDYGRNGNAIGVEITAPSAVPLERLNRVLTDPITRASGPARGQRGGRGAEADTLPDQARDCVGHKHGPNRKLDQIPVENPVSITGGSGSYPHR
jgi:hypothetical protein